MSSVCLVFLVKGFLAFITTPTISTTPEFTPNNYFRCSFKSAFQVMPDVIYELLREILKNNGASSFDLSFAAPISEALVFISRIFTNLTLFSMQWSKPQITPQYDIIICTDEGIVLTSVCKINGKNGHNASLILELQELPYFLLPDKITRLAFVSSKKTTRTISSEAVARTIHLLLMMELQNFFPSISCHQTVTFQIIDSHHVRNSMGNPSFPNLH